MVKWYFAEKADKSVRSKLCLPFDKEWVGVNNFYFIFIFQRRGWILTVRQVNVLRLPLTKLKILKINGKYNYEQKIVKSFYLNATLNTCFKFGVTGKFC